MDSLGTETQVFTSFKSNDCVTVRYVAADMDSLGTQTQVSTEKYIAAFRSVVMLRPSTPINPLYEQFLDESRNISYQPPFNAPVPPYGMKLSVSFQFLTVLYFCDVFFLFL